MFLLWIVFTVLSPIINTDFFVSFDRLFCRLILLPMSLLLTLVLLVFVVVVVVVVVFVAFVVVEVEVYFGCFPWNPQRNCGRLHLRFKYVVVWKNDADARSLDLMISLILSILKNSFNGNTALFLRFLNNVAVCKLIKKETIKRKYGK